MIGIEVRAPIPPDVIKDISSLHPQFQRDLPRKLEQQMVTVQVQPMAQVSPAITPQLGGVTFDEVGRSGESVQGLFIDLMRVGYFSTKYTRWTEIWPFTKRVLTACGKPVLQRSPVSAIL